MRRSTQRRAGGDATRIGRAVTTRALLSGENELLSITYDRSGLPLGDAFELRVVVDDPLAAPSDTLRECRPNNNAAMITASCQILF